MTTTISDVKNAARKVWPEAAQLNVQAIAATKNAPRRYRLSAISSHQSIIGHISAADLAALLESLETRISRKKFGAAVGNEAVDDE